MTNHQKRDQILAIVGPTGVGKSALAYRLAESFQGEIINADSRQIYRGMDIGTSKPQKKDMKEVKHHLIDIASPSVAYNLYSYLENSNQQIKEI